MLGVNVDDLGDHRPGQRAAAERGAVFPLVDAGFTKADVRAVVAAARPAHVGQAGGGLPGVARALRHAGDASRCSAGSSGPRRRCARSASAELRVRHYGDIARIEVPVDGSGDAWSSSATRSSTAVQARRLPLRDPRPRGPALRQPQRAALMEGPAETLAAAIEDALPGWVVRSVVNVATAAGREVDDSLRSAAEDAGERARADVGAAVRTLLATDIDAQHTNPSVVAPRRGALPDRGVA